MQDARVDLFAAALRGGRYDAGMILPPAVNDRVGSSYGPMLDWSAPGRLTFSSRRGGAASMDLYRSEEHTSELQSLMRISYAVFCLKKKKHYKNKTIVRTPTMYHTRK